MKLHWSPRSPFVRKVMIVLYETGIDDQVELVRTPVAMDKPNLDLVADNPLIKLPTLVLEDGTPLYDSRVICAYLNGLTGGRLLPAQAGARLV
ncbi:MAG: glutathione S-transferase N-terminal domain-containing protein, partial [Alcaligenes sp.]